MSPMPAILVVAFLMGLVAAFFTMPTDAVDLTISVSADGGQHDDI